MSGAEAERLKRLRLRAWRRGIRECDLILGGWADAHLAAADPATLDAFEALLVENDHDIYAWIAGAAPPPAPHAALVARIGATLDGRFGAPGEARKV